MADWGSRMVPPPMVPTSIEGMDTETWRSSRTLWRVSGWWLWGWRKGNVLSHDGNTVGRLHDLRGILTGGEEDGGDNVGGVGVETSHCTSHGGADEVLGDVHLYKIFDFALQN